MARGGQCFRLALDPTVEGDVAVDGHADPQSDFTRVGCSPRYRGQPLALSCDPVPHTNPSIEPLDRTLVTASHITAR